MTQMHNRSANGPGSSGGTPKAAKAASAAANAAAALAVAAAAAPTPAQAAPSPAGLVPAAAPPAAPAFKAHLPESLLPLFRGSEAVAGGGGAASRVQPRGLLNPGNLCFVNSILQALLGSSRFCHLLSALRSASTDLDPTAMPTLAALAALAAEFPPLQQPSSGDAAAAAVASDAAAAGKAAVAASALSVLLGGQAFMLPDSLLDVVSAFRPSAPASSAAVTLGPGAARRSNGMLHLEREQEDAHDFLEFMVDRMHSELAALGGADGASDAAVAAASPAAAAAAANAAKAAAEDEWLTKSGRRLTKRKQLRGDGETAVSALFRGTYVSTVTCEGHPPSETPEHFTSPTLHILSDKVRSVEDAFEELTAGEAISGYRPQDHSPPQEATKTVRLQRLPPLLCLFLMRFDPANLRQKITKQVAFPPRLKMKRGWLAADSGERNVEYELVSTVVHHGKAISSGHYTADVRQPDDSWLRFDDGNVFAVKQQDVLTNRPYLLFYQRVL
ncbi:Ubiquitin carboxyl-terminal hydrolase 24 [Micractinium conductrix]|uniref:Ubiquitin carboxyl-terminal hydrolase n=1 Tax=Micractinium conductrix TaxID=554055 RepID=A0A2P6V9J4_9CHLO|nr:Ubiquitin carboxyl-terminal hydrolase 24 [Micractinium conductrix]|eukprot:PSC70741.1 Ubiquitin carboxyl-terminal hydrolase 24 [Micractinium conductrix]